MIFRARSYTQHGNHDLRTQIIERELSEQPANEVEAAGVHGNLKLRDDSCQNVNIELLRTRRDCFAKPRRVERSLLVRSMFNYMNWAIEWGEGSRHIRQFLPPRPARPK